MTPDVNVLVAAFRGDHPHHGSAAAALKAVLTAQSSLVIVPMAAAAFLRLVTNPRVFPDPAPAERAVAFLDALLGHAHTRWLAARDEWKTFRGLCIDKRLGGNAIPDIWLAATVISLGEHLMTFDAGFRRLLPRRQLTVLS